MNDLLIISTMFDTILSIGTVAKMFSSSGVQAICTSQETCNRSPTSEENEDLNSSRGGEEDRRDDRAGLPLFFSLEGHS